MSHEIDSNLLAQVARMYYIYGNTQAEIAAEIKKSRSMVSMMLSKAKEQGIVEIKYEIRNPMSNHNFHSKEIEDTFKIRRCIVVPSSQTGLNIVAKIVAERAVEVFNESIRPGHKVGIAWGLTCYEFMAAYRAPRDIRNVTVVPLIGGSDRTNYAMQMNEMVRQFAEKANGSPIYIYAPAVATSVEERELYMQSSQMQTIATEWSNLDIAIVGVGTSPEQPELKELQINEKTLAYYTENPHIPVCDIAARQYNILGQPLFDGINDCVIGISPDALRAANEVICVAGGINKSFSIVGALRSGLIDVFICDEQTASQIIKISHM